ncbi:hypothetical protein N0V82_005864 [Gnomoniopsis sp. IMI 355080]|nr:hypothetical protein N0V82_005864 [Gnomoniopsis sp. IMI 355080]
MATTTNIPHAVAPASQAVTPVKQELPAQPEDTNGQSSPDFSTPDSDTILPPCISFVPEACLFCPQYFPNFDANLTHMQKNHGLFIPISIDDGTLHLAVDKETLVGYMHLVISEYHECIFCGTQRTGGWAARQHMVGRGHCMIDLAGSESEWRDFYESNDELEPDFKDDDEHGVEDEATPSFSGPHLVQTGEEEQVPRLCAADSLRLSSGKIVAHRAAASPRNPHRKPLTGEEIKRSRRGIDQILLEDLLPAPERASTTPGSFETDTAGASSTAVNAPQSSSSSSVVPSQPQALSRADRRMFLAANKSAVTAAITTMSKRDRAALAHLSPAQRRALVVGQFKQQERVQTAERKYWSKFERRQDQPAVGGKVYIGGG